LRLQLFNQVLRKIIALIPAYCLLNGTPVCAQDIDVSKYKEQYQLPIRKATDKIKVDGELNEEAWRNAAMAKDFWLKFPRDDEKTPTRTEVKVTYDNQFLYIGAVCYDSLPLVAQSLKRDSRIRENDGIGIVLDPMNKKTNGFYFAVTAYNVQADDLLTAGQEGELNFSWDNKWYSKTRIENDHYVIEAAIPFKTLRYDKSNMQWGINFIRSERKKNQFHTWARVPLNFPGTDLGYTGALVWDAAPPPPGTNISVIPYTTGGIKENKEENEGLSSDFNAGFDAKIALNSSLNLDLTVNPDFSQVEVDRQVTNITRFSIFFPERRNFFLENSDLFSSYGIPPIRPFYSRRIGLDNDANAIPIIAGARLTGNIAPKTRIGIMNMQTKSKKDFAAQNYTALSVNQQVLKRSSVRAYFFNRSAFETDKNPMNDPLDKYGRNAGAEFSFTNEQGNVQGWAGYHHSMKQTISSRNNYINLGGGYFGRQFTSFINLDNLGTNYYADMGFVQRIENYDAVKDTIIRLGFKSVYNETEYRLLPKKGKLAQVVFNLENFMVLNPDNSFNELNMEPSCSFEFKSTRRLEWGISYNRTKLLFPAAFTDADPLPAGEYSYLQGGIEYSSDSRKQLSVSTGLSGGGFYNGRLLQWAGTLTFRHQPKLVIDLNGEYNRLRFPSPYGSENLFLLSTRVEYSFSNNIFWTTFVQYNTQANNVNINSRFQWRFKPASDFFLVYTDNYFSSPFLKNKNRALVFKLNYWFNL